VTPQDTQPPVDVSILVVNYNGGDTVLECLRSVDAHTRDLAYETLLVDNGSRDGSPERVARVFPRIRLIRNPDNRGFSRACNQALRASRGRLVLLLNSDTLLVDNAVKAMADFLEANPQAGIAGCMLLNENGTYQKSAGRVRGLVNEWRERRARAALERGAPSARLREERFAGSVRPVDWVSGAFLMFRRALADPVGLLDERMALYFEDIDYCARVRNAGWQVLYNPRVRVIHLGGRSVSADPWRSRLEYRRSQLLFYATHHGAGPDTQLLRLYLMGKALNGFLAAGISPGLGPLERARTRELSRELFRMALRGRP